MRFLAVFKQYKLYFLISFLAIFILVLMATIVFVNSKGGFSNKPATPAVINYIGWDTLQQQINSAATDPIIKKSPYFSQFENLLKTLQNPSANEQNKYNSLLQAHAQLASLYIFTDSTTKVRSLLDALSVFAKNNFPKEYQQNDFNYPCESSTCSDDPPTQAFLNILSEIKNSDFPAIVKNNISKYLLTNSYLNKSGSLTKVRRSE